eukprot:15555_1
MSDQPIASKSEEETKTNIHDIQQSLDEYLSKSADLLQSNGEIIPDKKSKQPSLTISELQIHSFATSISTPKSVNANKRTKKFYQFLFIAVMVASLSILISLIFHFFELKRNTAYHTAYYKYLHKAIETKQKHPNESIIFACNQGIQHFDIISLYKSASINVADLQVDIDELEKHQTAKIPRKKLNSKEKLVIMCDVELTLMTNAIQDEQLEDAKLVAIKQQKKQHEEKSNDQ